MTTLFESLIHCCNVSDSGDELLLYINGMVLGEAILAYTDSNRLKLGLAKSMVGDRVIVFFFILC